MKIINKVKELRLEKGLSQSDLAKLSDTTRLTISNIEKSIHVPGLYLAHKIAKALNANLETLFVVIDP